MRDEEEEMEVRNGNGQVGTPGPLFETGSTSNDSWIWT